VKLVFTPISLALGLAAGIVGRKIFEQVWGLIDKEEPPEATTKYASWPKVLGAAAVEGVTFKVTRAAVDRAGARSFERLTGVWPGEKEPDAE
jgi:xanthosine utilization system XapX-like protein